MPVTVFDVFEEIDYEYLVVSRGNVYGNTITSSATHKGVFKLRSGMIQGDMELSESAATLHAHSEDYPDLSGIVGNGVRVNGVDYQITGMTLGTNFDNGKHEHLTFTLGAADYADYSQD